MKRDSIMHVLLIGVVFGIYLITHGQLTPGGDFQGGVILATAPLLVYLAGELETFKKTTGQAMVELGGAAGLGFFSENVLPFGTSGAAFSGCTIPYRLHDL